MGRVMGRKTTKRRPAQIKKCGIDHNSAHATILHIGLDKKKNRWSEIIKTTS